MAFVDFLDGAWLGLDFLLKLPFVGLVFCFLGRADDLETSGWDIWSTFS